MCHGLLFSAECHRTCTECATLYFVMRNEGLIRNLLVKDIVTTEWYNSRYSVRVKTTGAKPTVFNLNGDSHNGVKVFNTSCLNLF